LQLISDSKAKPEERLTGAQDLVGIHSADGRGKEKPLLNG
jgi:hypothetical protein